MIRDLVRLYRVLRNRFSKWEDCFICGDPLKVYHDMTDAVGKCCPGCGERLWVIRVKRNEYQKSLQSGGLTQ